MNTTMLETPLPPQQTRQVELVKAPSIGSLPVFDHHAGLEDTRPRPQRFTLRTVRERLRDDPWQGTSGRAPSLTPARRRLDTLRCDDA